MIGKIFDLVGLYRVIHAKIYVSYYLGLGRKNSAASVKFYLCPDNLVLMIRVNNKNLRAEKYTDIKMMLAIFEVLENKSDSKFQKAKYQSQDGKEEGVFDLFTIPLN